jgi:signal peptidase I
VGLVVTVVTFTAAGRGVKPLVVRSGSMEPTITTGSMVLTQPVDASEIRVGDVVSVRRADRRRVTHRVLAVERRGAAALTLKGHANQDPDPVPVTVRGAHRVIAKVPNVGRAATWLTSAQGGFLMGCIVTAFVTGALRRRSQGPDG